MMRVLTSHTMGLLLLWCGVFPTAIMMMMVSGGVVIMTMRAVAAAPPPVPGLLHTEPVEISRNLLNSPFDVCALEGVTHFNGDPSLRTILLITDAYQRILTAYFMHNHSLHVVAGNSSASSNLPVDGVGTAAQFRHPVGMSLVWLPSQLNAGNGLPNLPTLYLGDYGHLRVVSLSSMDVKTVHNHTVLHRYTNLRYTWPSYLIPIDATEGTVFSLYVADSFLDCIRRFDFHDVDVADMQVYAGVCQIFYFPYHSKDGPALNGARFVFPKGLVMTRGATEMYVAEHHMMNASYRHQLFGGVRRIHHGYVSTVFHHSEFGIEGQSFSIMHNVYLPYAEYREDQYLYVTTDAGLYRLRFNDTRELVMKDSETAALAVLADGTAYVVTGHLQDPLYRTTACCMEWLLTASGPAPPHENSTHPHPIIHHPNRTHPIIRPILHHGGMKIALAVLGMLCALVVAFVVWVCVAQRGRVHGEVGYAAFDGDSHHGMAGATVVPPQHTTTSHSAVDEEGAPVKTRYY